MAGPKSSAFRFDVNSAFERAQSQFRGLNMQEPGTWPMLPKVMVWLLVIAFVLALGYGLVINSAMDTLQAERNREPQLKADYRNKLGQAVNLNELRKQKLQVQEYVTQLEKQLPGKAEMDALLSDINQAGLGRGLLFDLFRPGQVEVKDYYAELPIAIRVSGRYHDIGSFAADVSNLSRIVTLQNLTITQLGSGASGQRSAEAAATGMLSMEATARTYRYLDANEVAERQRAAAAAAAAAKQGAKK